jgi:hypothetical protein
MHSTAKGILTIEGNDRKSGGARSHPVLAKVVEVLVRDVRDESKKLPLVSVRVRVRVHVHVHVCM